MMDRIFVRLAYDNDDDDDDDDDDVFITSCSDAFDIIVLQRRQR